MLFVLFVIARRIVHSPFGVSLRAVRDNPLRAAAVGIPVRPRLVAIYTIAAAYAGAAGALLAQTTQYVSLDVLAFDRSADVLLVLVIGGTGWLYGGLVGALAFKARQQRLPPRPGPRTCSAPAGGVSRCPAVPRARPHARKTRRSWTSANVPFDAVIATHGAELRG